jgi:hypothetical protein
VKKLFGRDENTAWVWVSGLLCAPPPRRLPDTTRHEEHNAATVSSVWFRGVDVHVCEVPNQKLSGTAPRPALVSLFEKEHEQRGVPTTRAQLVVCVAALRIYT